jgi:hypothetical protein
MKALLLFPPCWHPIMPHLALPSLTAYLREKGVQVVQRDLNVEFYDEILSKHYLGSVLNRLQRDSKHKAATEPLRWALNEGRQVVATIEQAKATLRNSRFYEAAIGLPALITITDGLRLASLPHEPAQVSLTGYQAAYPVDIPAAILVAARDREHNIFYDYFARLIVPQIAREKPDIIGVSLTSDRQIVAAFTLAHLLKEAGVRAHLTIGGKMITCWRELLPNSPELLTLFDSAILYGGEWPLYRLCTALDQKQSLESVPNLIYRKDGRVVANDLIAPLPVSELPLPDFQGLPLDRYFSPERVLPVTASRGCYWHRCAFCNVGYGESAHYQEKPVEKVAAEIKALAEKWGARRFFFCDEAVSPRMLKKLSALLLEQGAAYDWTGAARFESSLDAPTLQQLARSGCRMLMFGLESASPRVLECMDKGINLDVARRILREGTEAGIWNHIFFFFGFPGETAAEGEETVGFFQENSAHIHSICSGTFMLERHSRVAADPQRYDVSRLISSPERRLAFYFDYHVSAGMSEKEAEHIEAVFLDTLPVKERAHLYFHDIYRFLYACQFEKGASLPPMLEG